MHDTFLLKNIFKSLKSLCADYKIKTVKQLVVAVNPNSHINEESLKQHLKEYGDTLIDKDLRVVIKKKENVEDQTAIIMSISGEHFD